MADTPFDAEARHRQVVQFKRDLSKLIREYPDLSPTDLLSMATLVNLELMAIFLDACPTEDMRREVRKGLHVFPEALTQFLHGWQASRSKDIMATACTEMVRKWQEAIGKAEASTRRAAYLPAGRR